MASSASKDKLYDRETPAPAISVDDVQYFALKLVSAASEISPFGIPPVSSSPIRISAALEPGIPTRVVGLASSYCGVVCSDTSVEVSLFVVTSSAEFVLDGEPVQAVRAHTKQSAKTPATTFFIK